ncbi:uncharacterized protein NECHADRAFT_44531 [Fusarium vanettenii 77-13-4]|uniref:Luciferase-like domain-containing protein n=1 Tax=Fusarium vanettenii (strain ATCC MYA-4622 / CBS 123669 / FGSC 9596 / NRRL 45880 / 77-13-4) TaxID=660122 RepID=C7ZNE3_FUSV7|nr:uncharacterized protein NECHADRAFT_44531 [Fusarium vanettenii 77-13-4]EEU34457.1 hypothetical protein NECHADRAFT_44531 [Fusarium vanettenii 77-13-4]
MAEPETANKSQAKKKLILNAFVEACSGHQSPGLWQHPDDRSSEFNTLKHWVELAKLLETAGFHGIFIADVLGAYDVYKGPRNVGPAAGSGAQFPVNDPLGPVSAMAAATESIGFGLTVSTTFEEPYHLARRLSTLDHLTGGRVGWNRYAKADEYMDVVYKLWQVHRRLQSSWRDDAVKLDRQSGVYTDPELVRTIDHVGKFYNVPGPHICQPSPQRTPVILQAGTSSAGKAFAAKHAEAVFVSTLAPGIVAQNIADIRAKARELGRDPQAIKFLAMVTPVLGATEEEAQGKYNEYLSYGSKEGALALFGGYTGIDLSQFDDDEELQYVESNAIRTSVETWAKYVAHVPKWTKGAIVDEMKIGGLGATIVGTPEHVADELERWIREADVDGFNFAYALMPRTFEEIIEFLLPVLRNRGLFWEGYEVPGGTYRENLWAKKGAARPPSNHPAAKYHWKKPEWS